MNTHAKLFSAALVATAMTGAIAVAEEHGQIFVREIGVGRDHIHMAILVQVTHRKG